MSQSMFQWFCIKWAFSSFKVEALVEHTLHLKVRGSFDLVIVMVLVLNTPLTGFSSTASQESDLSALHLGLPVLSLVASGDNVLVVSDNTFFGCVVVSSGPSGVFPAVLSGIIKASKSVVASESTLLSSVCLFIWTDPCAGSVAAGNEFELGVLVCLLALFVSITCWVAIRLTEG